MAFIKKPLIFVILTCLGSKIVIFVPLTLKKKVLSDIRLGIDCDHQNDLIAIFRELGLIFSHLWAERAHILGFCTTHGYYKILNYGPDWPHGKVLKNCQNHQI